MASNPSVLDEITQDCSEWRGLASVPEVLRLKEFGCSIVAIAKRFNVSRRTVHKALRQFKANKEDQDHADSARPFDPSASREP